MARMLKQYSDINVVISQNDDMTFGALEAMKEAGVKAGEGDIRVISFDATRSALELVQQNHHGGYRLQSGPGHLCG